MPNAPDIANKMYPSLVTNCETAFDTIVAGSTATDKVWSGTVPETDSAGNRLLPPWVLIHSLTQQRGQASNFTQDGGDGSFTVTVATQDPAGATLARQIAEAIQAQLSPSNVTATGFKILSLYRDGGGERPPLTDPQGDYHYIDQIYAYSAYPS